MDRGEHHCGGQRPREHGCRRSRRGGSGNGRPHVDALPWGQGLALSQSASRQGHIRLWMGSRLADFIRTMSHIVVTRGGWDQVRDGGRSV
eukprot:3572445-Pyramimonas_sp.AAC.1